jgi:hypothetical protein
MRRKKRGRKEKMKEHGKKEELNEEWCKEINEKGLVFQKQKSQRHTGASRASDGNKSEVMERWNNKM